ncbi:MAG: hypothetical protein CMQ43_10520 [Gammaproteobacteria bacterium]|jgi:hypothetical protein|nr:hypothetical protein [Gammaproteobacteria bacterium]MBK81328.1 hypothetical protein [Gammaproteobacteria bacterium]|tara:strand:- start:10383 stop:10643 length:261 start_codon:yes stop_codon:yes gene_type:complete
MTTATLGRVRRSILPRAEDTWASIAARELPDLPAEDAVKTLQSLNLHVFMRPAAPEGSARAGNPILPSDVIFVEPPLASAKASEAS